MNVMSSNKIQFSLWLAVQHVDISPIMNSVAAVHHSTAPPLMVQHSMDNKSRPPPITPVIQNTNQVILGKLKKNFYSNNVTNSCTLQNKLYIYNHN